MATIEPLALTLLRRILQIASESEQTPHASLEKQVAMWRAARINVELALDLMQAKQDKRRDARFTSASPTPFTDAIRTGLGPPYNTVRVEDDEDPEPLARTALTVCAHGVPLEMECEQCLTE